MNIAAYLICHYSTSGFLGSYGILFYLFLNLFLLWYAVSLVVTCKLLVTVCGIYFPDQVSNLGSMHWEGVLATGPSERSLYRI